jgi:hypothetical protein
LAIDNYDDRLALNLPIDTQRKPRQIEGFTPQTLFAPIY